MEANTKRSKQAIPTNRKKLDTTVKPDVEHLVEAQRIAERKQYPLRIDQQTVIYVSKEKCTPEYAEAKRRKMNTLPPPPEQKGGRRVYLDREELRLLVQSGMYLKDIARKLGVSKTTVDKYVQKYNLRNKTIEEDIIVNYQHL